MKRILVVVTAALALAGCADFQASPRDRAGVATAAAETVVLDPPANTERFAPPFGR
jgi:hypothetical protein